MATEVPERHEEYAEQAALIEEGRAARQLRRENARLREESTKLRELWTEARVVVAKSRDANCLMSYGAAQVDAVEACNAWLNKMPTQQ